MTYTEIEKEALSLTPEDQSRLVNSLASHIEGATDSEIAHSWALESLRRLKELNDGIANEVPLEDALRRARMAISREQSHFTKMQMPSSCGSRPTTILRSSGYRLGRVNTK